MRIGGRAAGVAGGLGVTCWAPRSSVPVTVEARAKGAVLVLNSLKEATEPGLRAEGRFL